jgi:hypothetical protein
MLTTHLSSLLLASLGSLSGNGETPRPAVVQTVHVAVGALRGTVLDAATRRPLAGQALRLVDGKGAELAQLTSGADGAYTMPALPCGQYVLQIGQELRMRLAVENDAKVQQLDIVLPQGPAKPQGPKKVVPQDPKTVPAAPGGAAPMSTTLASLPAPITPGIGIGTWAIAAGGAALVATPIVASSGGSSGGETPVSSSGLGLRR